MTACRGIVRRSTPALCLLACIACRGQATEADNAAAVTEGDSTGGAHDTDLVLDYTAFVEGAIQVSGIGIDRGSGTVALVTDFEKVILVDPQSVSAIADFSAQFGELPMQGSTEAVAFRSDGDIAVLYPEHKTLRVYDGEAQGSIRAEVDLGAIDGALHGCLTIDPQDDVAFVVAGADPVSLVSFAVDGGDVLRSVPIDGEIEREITGLSLSVSGSATQLWAVSEDNRAFVVDAASGVATLRGTLSEVGESSGAEAFTSPNGEPVVAVSDDLDAYNDEPGPLRLYLSE